MTNEVVLFLSAGVFSFGLQSLLAGQGLYCHLASLMPGRRA